jgi:hypothetical protein
MVVVMMIVMMMVIMTTITIVVMTTITIVIMIAADHWIEVCSIVVLSHGKCPRI